MTTRFKPATVGLAAAIAAACTVCHAQAWPSRPIRMLVGFPPGGRSS